MSTATPATLCRHQLPPEQCADCVRAAKVEQKIRELRAAKRGYRRPFRPRKPRPRGPTAARLVVLVAALGLGPAWSLEQVAVAAWQADPGRFGLRGYETVYPDFHLARCYFDGTRGLVAKGLVARSVDGLYLLTPAGREAARQGKM